MIVAVVFRLCPFGPWLTFIFGTKMADITSHAFHLYEQELATASIPHPTPEHTHGSSLSHLSLDALQREQDKVNLRVPDSEPPETLILAFPSRVLWLAIGVVKGKLTCSIQHSDCWMHALALK